MIRSITWQQLAVLVVCLAAAFAAHKWLGVTEGMTAGFVTSIIAFLLGRAPEIPVHEEPPAAPAAVATVVQPDRPSNKQIRGFRA